MKKLNAKAALLMAATLMTVSFLLQGCNGGSSKLSHEDSVNIAKAVNVNAPAATKIFKTVDCDYITSCLNKFYTTYSRSSDENVRKGQTIAVSFGADELRKWIDDQKDANKVDSFKMEFGVYTQYFKGKLIDYFREANDQLGLDLANAIDTNRLTTFISSYVGSEKKACYNLGSLDPSPDPHLSKTTALPKK